MQLWHFLTQLAQWLDPVNSLIGLATSIIAAFTGVMVWRESRMRRRWLREIRSQPGRRPVVFIIDALPQRSIRAQVEHFCHQSETLKDIPPERFFVLQWQDHLTPETYADFIAKVGERVAQVMAAGADRIHLFLSGPLAASAAAGAELANQRLVHVYQHDREKGYVNFGPLRPPA